MMQKSKRPLSLGIMASGSGSNAECIMKWCFEHQLEANVKVLFSNKNNVGCLLKAKHYNIPTICMPYPKQKNEVLAHEIRIANALREFNLDAVLLAGYMKILSPEFLQYFKVQELNRSEIANFNVFNIHPSLLPAFKGAHAYHDAFNFGVMISGVTIHKVSEELDGGRIILQKAFNRSDKDTIETFIEKGRKVEMELWPLFLTKLCQGEI